MEKPLSLRERRKSWNNNENEGGQRRLESSTNPIKSQIYTLENSLLRDQIVMKADLECPGFAMESLSPGCKEINVELKETIGNDKEP